MDKRKRNDDNKIPNKYKRNFFSINVSDSNHLLHDICNIIGTGDRQRSEDNLSTWNVVERGSSCNRENTYKGIGILHVLLPLNSGTSSLTKSRMAVNLSVPAVSNISIMHSFPPNVASLRYESSSKSSTSD